MRSIAAFVICLALSLTSAESQQSAPTSAQPVRSFPICTSAETSAVSGKTALGFDVTSKGEVSDAKVIQSSGDASLDSAALSCLVKAHLAWDMSNQHAIRGGLVANGYAEVNWVQGGTSTLFFACPYPIIPLRLQQQGEVSVSFRILNDGTVTGVTVTKSSGFEDLDNAALSCAAQSRYAPLTGQGGLDWHATVGFRLVG